MLSANVFHFGTILWELLTRRSAADGLLDAYQLVRNGYYCCCILLLCGIIAAAFCFFASLCLIPPPFASLLPLFLYKFIIVTESPIISNT